jgi:hypothetical protein
MKFFFSDLVGTNACCSEAWDPNSPISLNLPYMHSIATGFEQV